MSKDKLQALKNRIDCKLDAYLSVLLPNYDDSVTGFNIAWDLVRKILAEEIEKCTPPQTPN